MVPRPIGWVSTLGKDGVANLAPYSFFNAVSDRPPMLMFSSGGHKDSLRNIEDTGEFTCSIATWALREAMNLSSALVAPGVDEFELAGLTKAASRFVKPPRVAESPAAFECKLWQTLPLPPRRRAARATRWSSAPSSASTSTTPSSRTASCKAARCAPLARLGYMDYSVLTPEVDVHDEPAAWPATTGSAPAWGPAPWDGVYR